MPTPTGLVVKKGSKMRVCTSGGMPGPLSWNSSRTPSGGAAGLDADLALAVDRVAGVHQQVQEDLVQLAGIAAHARELPVIAHHRDRVLEARLHQRQRAIDLLVQVGVLQVGLVHAREGAQVLHDLLDALGALAAAREQLADGLANALGVGVRALALDELLDVLVEQLEIRVHEADRIVELVGDARDELAQRLHLLRLRELRLDVAQLARALLDARLERLVELRDLVEGLGVLDRDRALVRERAQQQAVVRGEAIAGELAPHGDHAEQIDAVEDRDEQLDLERVEHVAAGLAALEIVLVVEIDAREVLAPHPQVLPDRVVGGDLDLERIAVPIAARGDRLQQLALVVDQQHHRALDAHRVRQRHEDAIRDLAERQHRDHRLGDLAHRHPVGGAIAVEEAVDERLQAVAQRD